MAKKGRTIEVETDVLPPKGKGIDVVIDAAACRTATLVIVGKVLPTAMHRLLASIYKTAKAGEYEYVITKSELAELGCDGYCDHVIQQLRQRLFRTQVGKFEVDQGDYGWKGRREEVGILVSWRESAQG